MYAQIAQNTMHTLQGHQIRTASSHSESVAKAAYFPILYRCQYSYNIPLDFFVQLLSPAPTPISLISLSSSRLTNIGLTTRR